MKRNLNKSYPEYLKLFEYDKKKVEDLFKRRPFAVDKEGNPIAKSFTHHPNIQMALTLQFSEMQTYLKSNFTLKIGLTITI
jgi:hypothetical protein